MNRLFVAAAGAVFLLGSAVAVHATDFASKVISYQAGNASVTNPTFTDPSAALGSPDGITGVKAGFPNVLSPFSPSYDIGQIVVIGEGGELTLEFPQPVQVGSGPAIGVISNSGLIDTSYPSGQAGNPAGNFGGGSADVSVSADGIHWVSLGEKEFVNPANFYLNAGPYDATAPASPQPADFGKPFTGTLASFNGESYSQVLATLAGSGGGTWLDLSGSGLTQIDFIEFSVPTDGTSFGGSIGSRLPIDAVAVADGHVGITTVPLPRALPMGLIALAGVAALRWLRRRSRLAGSRA